MRYLTTRSLGIRTVMLLVAAVITFGWLVFLCGTHEHNCHDLCMCALPCCQAAVISGAGIAITHLDLAGVVPVADQTASSHNIDPFLRPPKA